MKIIDEIKKHRSVSIMCGMALALVIGGFFWAYGMLAGATGPFVIHFDSVNGITQIGGLAILLQVGIFGIVIVGVDTVLAFALARRNPFLGRFLAAMTLLLAALLFIGFAAILGVN